MHNDEVFGELDLLQEAMNILSAFTKRNGTRLSMERRRRRAETQSGSEHEPRLKLRLSTRREWLSGMNAVLVFVTACGLFINSVFCGSTHLEGQLYEDLLYDYNKIPRPVKNSTDILTVDVGASLIRIIDVDEKNQILTTNLWLEMQWIDAKLMWNPAKYGGLKTLHIPSDLIWTPDLVLYNNAAGDPDITIFTDALVAYDGRVFWQPPAIYKSFCPIDVTWFPYDSQSCEMKFGAWSYTGYYVDLKQLPKDQVVNGTDKYGQDVETMEMGMDLSFFYRQVWNPYYEHSCSHRMLKLFSMSVPLKRKIWFSSAEWDLLSLSSARHSVLYTSCCGPEKYVDITYYFVLRRKTLFFTCNLIVPCFLISLLTTFVFYLSDHKITFSISILVTLTVFFLVLIDIMPPTSLVIPMFGRYLITTMILVSLSTVVSVITVNFRFRSGSAHQMSPWIRSIFLNFLPKVLFMSRPEPKPKPDPAMNTLVDATSLVGVGLSPTEGLHADCKESLSNAFSCPPSTSKGEKTMPESNKRYPLNCNKSFEFRKNPYRQHGEKQKTTSNSIRVGRHAEQNRHAQRRMQDAIFLNLLQQVRFIAEHFQHREDEAEISDDWTFVAMVLDRLFLIIFSILNVGTFLIILEAPSLYDTREPMNITVASKPLGQANVLGGHSRF
ncbi:unnamed protein product [Toxocara canis]|uniref:Acetylcholine receptor subunit alpha-type unc-63 n=1 Tax=Toxocara canis TaxID=6265 RepID=A0A183UDT6_TOXCA|nr:unnamed protein product [Toxocara canis]